MHSIFVLLIGHLTKHTFLLLKLPKCYFLFLNNSIIYKNSLREIIINFNVLYFTSITSSHAMINQTKIEFMLHMMLT